MKPWRCLSRTLLTTAVLALPRLAHAADLHGQVLFNGLPVPGATVTATQGAKHLSTLTDQQGLYTFTDLANGAATVEIEMLLFAPVKQDVTVTAETPFAHSELKLLPYTEIIAKATAPRIAPIIAPSLKPAPAADARKSDAPIPDIPKPPDSNDGLLINGSSSNAATSQYSLDRAFGNRRNSKSLYNGSLGLIYDNAATDAKPYSLTGLESPKAGYNRTTAVATFGGPLNIPHVMPHGPNLFLAYQWQRDSVSNILSGLVPTAAERAGDLSADPAAPARVAVTPQAAALLALYPLPNLTGNTQYNYQVNTLNNTHLDALQSRLDKTVTRRDQLYGGVAFQSSRANAASLFGFTDTTDTLGLTTNINWSHRFNSRFYQTVGYKFSRLRTDITPNFENRQNISALAGINGNDQDPTNWGPPTLAFSNGIYSLTDTQSAFNRNRTDGFSYSATYNYRGHNITAGGDLRRQENNVFSQSNPRGTFTFTGAATGNALADFLTGTPDTSQIAFGNADKYLRQTVYDLFANDDWRLRPDLTLSIGLRWEYGAPITEIKNRLVNLDSAPNFAAVTPVLASNPQGTLSGQQYPSSLIRPDHLGIEPRLGLSWRPIPGSTLVIRAGYGVYDDTSVYLATALQLAQQAPLSKSLSVSNSAACPLTLANGFNNCASTTANTFAVDPNFRVGYAQTWQLSAQRDLPAALVATVTYLGIKGTRGVQEFLPNTYPIGAVNPCPLCPAGFVFRTSNGNSTRESLQAQLRRRLRSGFTATLQYTLSKSIDDDSTLGGQGPVGTTSTQSAVQAALPAGVPAQNWLNLSGERGPSSFDQRNLLNLTLQYTSGQGLHGGSLMTGRRGIFLKDWTALGTLVAGSGLPENPIYLAATPGTGYTGNIRPNPTGAPLYSAPAGYHLNPAAFAAPALGQWGTAERNSINGPGVLTFNFSLARTFRVRDHYTLDLRVDSTNLLNHVNFTGWNTIINGTTFGLPTAANPMRSLQTTLRLRY